MVKDSAGAAVYPMYKLRIVDTSSSDFPVLKEYERADSYILSVTQQGHTLFLNRAVRSGDTMCLSTGTRYRTVPGEPNRAVTIQGTADNALGKVTRIVMAGTGDEETAASVRFREAELTEAEGNRSILLETSTQAERYFCVCGEQCDAIHRAHVGGCRGGGCRYGYRGGQPSALCLETGQEHGPHSFSDLEVGSYDTASGSSARCLSAMLAREGKNVGGGFPAVAGADARGGSPGGAGGSGGPGSDRMHAEPGCSTMSASEIRSTDGRGRDAAMLVTGYDASSVSLWDPMTGETQRMGLTDAENLFAAAGNVFVSYAE